MKTYSPTVSAILLSGGQGLRLGSSTPKQYLPLQCKPIVLHSFELLLSHPFIQEIVVVCQPEFQHIFSSDQKKIVLAEPGQRRQDSVLQGFKKCRPDADLICIHDAARPLLSFEDLDRVLKEASLHKAAALAVPAKNTIKQVDGEGFVVNTLDRSHLWEMQTPQVIAPFLLRTGFIRAIEEEVTVTDDAALVELTGNKVKLVMGSYSNIKITTWEDKIFAKAYMEELACTSTN